MIDMREAQVFLQQFPSKKTYFVFENSLNIVRRYVKGHSISKYLSHFQNLGATSVAAVAPADTSLSAIDYSSFKH